MNYAINISINGNPFYIFPNALDISDLKMQSVYYPDAGLYYLFDKGIVVYIGASRTNVQKRILSHVKDKKFDSYFILTCVGSNKIIDNVLLEKAIISEAKLINIFQPIYNGRSNIALSPIRQTQN